MSSGSLAGGHGSQLLASLGSDFVLSGHVILETLLLVVIVWLMMQKSYKPQKRQLTEQEMDQLCEEWKPEPLHPEVTLDNEYEPVVLESTADTWTQVSGQAVLNLSSTNFLGFVAHPAIQAACEATVTKYGVGACGPRGFYGSIDVHLDFERRVSAFLGVPGCILYSYSLATASSALPAFCKRGDIIIADEGVNWSIQNGLLLSRSNVSFFRHNDMEDLEEKLRDAVSRDRGRRVRNRRFIVVESIYQNSGQLAPLDVLVRLKEQYKFRLFVDESLSFGVLGQTGRGATEHFKIPVFQLDVMVSSMSNSLACDGGFCCGASDMVDHQRLSGLGYCFSASLPPFLATAGIAALDLLEDCPKLLVTLRLRLRCMRQALEQVRGVVVGSSLVSPIIFLHLQKSTGTFSQDSRLLQQIVDKMLHQHKVLLTVSKRSPFDRCRLEAGIRVAVSAKHTEQELVEAAGYLKEAAEAVFGDR